MSGAHLMKTMCCFMIALALIPVSPGASADEHKLSEITVAYLQQWPSPSQFAQAKKTFDYALGLTVNWVPFTSGNDMNAAMAAGDVQIAYSQGHVPFLVGVTTGLDLTMVGIAVGYPGNDNCIVRNDAGINRANANRLEGRKIATRVGSVTHYRMLKVLEHLGVDESRVEIIPVPNGAAAAASLRRAEVVMACASGSSLRDMVSLGKPLMTGAEQETIGLNVFDIVAVPTHFLDQHPRIVQAFMDVSEASNLQWARTPDPMRITIAQAAEMNQKGSNRALEGFRFPTAKEQKSDAWMARRIPVYTKEIADFFVTQGQLEKALDNYDRFITTRFLH